MLWHTERNSRQQKLYEIEYMSRSIAKNSVLEHSVQRRLQVKRVTRAQHAIFTKATDRMQPFEACIIEISICFYSD